MKRKIGSTIITLLCAWLLLSSCTFNPMSRHNELTGSAAGTAIGAGFGAGLMALLHAPQELIVAGGIGGAGIGYYVTSLRFASGGIMQAGGDVFTLGDSIAIEIPSDKLFDVGSSEILPEAYPILDSAISVLNRSPCNNILISGSTSGFGSTKYEQKLSEDRAREVAGYLWANGINGFQDQSIKLRKLIYVGYGSYFPIANNITSKGIRQNSRIQITAYPTKAQLHLDKRFKVFNNIGSMDQAPLTQKEPPYDYTRDFSGDTLPEGYNNPQNTTYGPSLKGEAIPNKDSTITGSIPTPEPSRDYKNEGGFKGER